MSEIKIKLVGERVSNDMADYSRNDYTSFHVTNYTQNVFRPSSNSTGCLVAAPFVSSLPPSNGESRYFERFNR